MGILLAFAPFIVFVLGQRLVGVTTGLVLAALLISADATFDEMRLRLDEHETLMVFTDGVLKARNEDRELYRFDRVASLMATRPTVEQVVRTACAFGQEDDITAVSVTRTADEPAGFIGGGKGHRSVSGS
jgi:Stage II sporulation protein E (SpoIIE)